MIIKCQKCGHENQQASIFCRKCGVKLDKEQIEEAIVNQRKNTKLKNRIHTVRRTITLIIVALIIYGLFLIFYPTFFPASEPKLSKDEFREAAVRLHSLELRSNPDYTFSSPETTVLYRKYFMSKNLRNAPLLISAEKNNTIKFSITKQIHDSVPVKLNYSIIATPIYQEIKGKKTLVDIDIKKVKIGNLAVPSYLAKYIIQEFKPYYSRNAQSFVKKLSKVESDNNGNFIIHLKSRKIIN